LKLC
jgi:hypothetical protein